MSIYKSLFTKTGLTMSVSLFVLSQAAPAFAQVGAATGTADPGRAQNQFIEQKDLPDVSPSVEVNNLIQQNVPAGAENIKFTLKSIQIDGATAYTQAELESLYADKVGTTVSLADIYAIASTLTNKFRNDGYILTQIVVPPQTIEGGVAHLRAVEGYIDNIVVEGEEDPHALHLIRSYAGHIRTGKALNVRDLERYLLLINDLPGVEARSILSPSKGKVGAADLRVIVKRDPFDGLLALDNYGSRYLGPLQATAAGSLNSYFGMNEKITGQIVVAPQLGEALELAYVMLSYEQPIFDEGTTVEVLGSYTDTEPGWTLDEFDVEGKSRFFRVKVKHPFIRSRSQNLLGHVAFDMRRVDTKNLLEALPREDKIRSLRIGGRYEVLDTLIGVGVNSADVEFSKGLGVFHASNKDAPELSRLEGDPTYSKLTAELQRLQRVTSNLNVLMNVSGQWSGQALLSSEEFGIGGMNIGRGYDPSEIVGDEGLAGKVEVQWNEPQPIPHIDDYQLYSFYDVGVVWNDDATTSAGKRDSIASVGAGVRADVFNKTTQAGVAVAFPLTRDVETKDDTDPRFYFNLSRKF